MRWRVWTILCDGTAEKSIYEYEKKAEAEYEIIFSNSPSMRKRSFVVNDENEKQMVMQKTMELMG